MFYPLFSGLKMSNDVKLEVQSVHLYPLENGKNHHTINYEVMHREDPTIVLRRAQSFHLVVTFSGRGYDSDKDIIQFIFTYGTAIIKLNYNNCDNISY